MLRSQQTKSVFFISSARSPASQVFKLEFVRKTTGAIGTGIGVNKKSGKTTD
jgi:hypothetical protein